MSKKKMYIASAVIAAVLVAVFALLFRSGGRIVSVLEFAGTAGLERGRREEAIQKLDIFEGMRLQPGDLVWTKESSSVTMMVDEDKAVRLEENSQAEFSQITGARGVQLTEIDLKKGTLVNDLQRKLEDNVTYKITTPNATVSVRGTYFVVYVGEEKGYTGLVTKVNVYDGVVAVESKSGEITILHAGNEKVEQWEEWENGLNVPSGNRALVGDQELYTLKGVDFEGLHAKDLDRLEEIVKKGGTALTMEEIEAHRKVLEESALPEEEEAAALEPQEEKAEQPEQDGRMEQENGGGTALESAEGKQTGVDRDGKDDASDALEGAGESADQTELPGVPAEEGPVEELPPQADVSPGQNTGTESGGSGSHEGGTSSGGETGGTVLDQEKIKYAPAQIAVENRQELQDRILALTVRKDALKEDATTPAKQAIITDVENKIAAAQNALNEAQTRVDHVNAALDLINALPYPCQTTALDSAQVAAARAAYDALLVDERVLVPQRSLDKLKACEAAKQRPSVN